MSVTLRPLRGDDPAEVAATHRMLAEARGHDVPDAPPYPLAEFSGRLTHPWPWARERYAVALDETGAVVGFLALSLPSNDNLHLAAIELVVDRAHRRHGVGRLLFAHARELAAEEGRTTMTGEYVVGRDGGEPRDEAPALFMAAIGVDRALPETRRRLDLADAPDLPAMLASARAHAAGYTTVTWLGPPPAEYVDDVARLDGRLLEDAPTGDLKIEPMAVDAERVRAGEEVARLRGRRTYHTGAIHTASGRLVAFSSIGMDAEVTTHGWQHITIVDPPHRGHRLGLLVKLVNLDHTRAHEPGLAHVNTWNAQENSHMIAVNEAMGFRPVDDWLSWQLDLQPPASTAAA